MSPNRVCEPCSGTGYTSQSFAVLFGILAGLAVFLYVVAKAWKAFPLKHLARCAFQPGRILITYSQVTSQLGDVLDFTYPGVFGDVIDFIRPVMDLWGLLFRALGPSECFGVKGFTAKVTTTPFKFENPCSLADLEGGLRQWLLRVVGLPVLLSTVVALLYIQQRHSIGAAKAGSNAKGQMFMVRIAQLAHDILSPLTPPCAIRLSSSATRRSASFRLHPSYAASSLSTTVSWRLTTPSSARTLAIGLSKECRSQSSCSSPLVCLCSSAIYF